MDKLVVRGGSPIRGRLEVGGSKNTALMLMAGALLADGKTRIKHVPVLRDISTFSQVIRVAGAEVSLNAEQHTLDIDASIIDRYEAPYELVKKMRASFYMLGALLGRFGQARVSLPGGCAWGPRPVNLHIEGMAALGADISLDAGYVVARARGGRLAGGTFRFEPSSVGATVNLMLAAVLASGSTRLENVAIEPDVVEFALALQKMGAHISGIGTRTLEIEGVDALSPTEIINCSDRIEAGTYMIAAAIAGEPGVPFVVDRAQPGYLGEAFLSAIRETGAEVESSDDAVTITPPETLHPVSVVVDVYPGFPTDLQAQWSVLLTQTSGLASVRDPIYPDRFAHIPELVRLGADANVAGDTVTIRGGRRLVGAQVMSTDLRASVSLVLAGMVADGETHVLRVYHLDRGYERIEEKLRGAGVDIRRERYEEFQQPVPHIV